MPPGGGEEGRGRVRASKVTKSGSSRLNFELGLPPTGIDHSPAEFPRLCRGVGVRGGRRGGKRIHIPKRCTNPPTIPVSRSVSVVGHTNEDVDLSPVTENHIAYGHQLCLADTDFHDQGWPWPAEKRLIRDQRGVDAVCEIVIGAWAGEDAGIRLFAWARLPKVCNVSIWFGSNAEVVPVLPSR
jgi:hypothetical protein